MKLTREMFLSALINAAASKPKNGAEFKQAFYAGAIGDADVIAKASLLELLQVLTIGDVLDALEANADEF